MVGATSLASPGLKFGPGVVKQPGRCLKDIYLLPLEPSVRVMMGLPANSGRSALTVDDGLDAEHWAQAEFGGAALGDARLAQRLAASAEAMAEKPGRAFCGVAKGDVEDKRFKRDSKHTSKV